MSYGLDELITKFRQEMEDTVEPYLWSEDEITDYLDEAEDDFTSEVDVLLDRITIDYVADDQTVAIPSYVNRVREVKGDDGRKLSLLNLEQFEMHVKADDYGKWTVPRNWEADTGVRPTALITDWDFTEARMYPIPTQDGTLTLNVYRRPVLPLADRGELEVSDRRHQRCILLKARALGYRKHDSEAFNPQLAEEFEVRFMASMQELKTDVARSRRRAGTVVYGGL